MAKIKMNINSCIITTELNKKYMYINIFFLLLRKYNVQIKTAL